MAKTRPIQPSVSDYTLEELQDPGFFDFLYPSNIWNFVVGLGECWLFSRPLRRLAIGAPFLIAVFVFVLCYWWVRHSDEATILTSYEQQFNSAGLKDDKALQETCLKALASLRPMEPQYRLRLGEFLVRGGKPEEGYREIQALAPDRGVGSPEARMWLVRQAISTEPIQRLSPEAIEKHLLLVLQADPKHADAHQMLAGYYTSRREWNLAERHMLDAAVIRPVLYLDVARLKVFLKRPREDVRSAAQSAVDALSAELEKDLKNDDVRIRLSEATTLLGDATRGREILISGLQSHESAQLHQAVVQHDLNQVQLLLGQSPLNRDACLPVVLEALAIAPDSAAAVQILTQLRSLGARIEPEKLTRSLEHWKKECEKNPESAESHMILSQLLVLCGRPEEAARQMDVVIRQRPIARLTKAQLLLLSDSKEEARSILESLVDESTATLASRPDDVAAAVQQVESLISLQRFSEARATLAKFTKDGSLQSVPSDPMLAALFGRAAITEFDALTGFTQGSESDAPFQFQASSAPEQLLGLLADSIRCPGSALQGIDRLARLALSDDPIAVRADDMIRQLRVHHDANVAALNLLGMHALLMKRYDKAISWLELANSLSDGREAQITNNLAVALIRGRPEQQDKALSLAEDTVKRLPRNADALSTRGEVLVAMERWNDAIADLTASLKIRNDNPQVHRLLAKAYEGQGDIAMAVQHRSLAEDMEKRSQAEATSTQK